MPRSTAAMLIFLPHDALFQHHLPRRMYKEADGYGGTFKFMYLATGKANGQIPASFDASASDLVLLACKAKGDCDFTRV
jgi:hypothetical protein